jgi:protoporphyrinogen oxidase
MADAPIHSGKTAIIIGAGPAGLTAAYELLQRTGIKPEIYELSDEIGGLARTVNYKGNRMDIGGHRFFSKSDRVMNWWKNILPIQGIENQNGAAIGIHYQNKSRAIEAQPDGPNPDKTDRVMLIRRRVSRIFFLRKFFDYPISLSAGTLGNLGLIRAGRIGVSYSWACVFQIRPEKSLEDFFINRFGRELYGTFFKDYTEKVWGVPCDKIKPEWGAQRIKGLSITRAVVHAMKSVFSSDASVAQKKIETSLIERFLYPKFGPGQIWEETARQVTAKGGALHHRYRAVGLEWKGKRIVAARFRNEATGETITRKADYFFSTMPVKELIEGMGPEVPADVREVASGLIYRDFITVGLLLKKLSVKQGSRADATVPDNWIYIQERDVKIGRLQIFNNWSPYLVKDPNTVWLGLEYFCNEGDELWKKTDAEFSTFAAGELAKLGVIDPADVLDSVVIRVPKTYPAYFGSYDRFDVIRRFVDTFENLFLVGRNGMHRYNNQDHSMLTAMTAVDNIVGGIVAKENLWNVNAEMEYHEERKES